MCSQRAKGKRHANLELKGNSQGTVLGWGIPGGQANQYTRSQKGTQRTLISKEKTRGATEVRLQKKEKRATGSKQM